MGSSFPLCSTAVCSVTHPSAVGSRNERLSCYRFIGKGCKLDWKCQFIRTRGKEIKVLEILILLEVGLSG